MDIRDAVEKARAIALPADREVLHLLPQEFILDDQGGVRDPAGMLGARTGGPAFVGSGNPGGALP